MIQKTAFVTLSLTALLLSACSGTKKASRPAEKASLAAAFKEAFSIGTAMNSQQINEQDPKAALLIPSQFNAVTPENIMKAEIIHPGWAQYNFELADKLVAYAKKNQLEVNAHTLIWHSQLPGFVRRLKSADSVRMYMANHIATVAGRYDGKVYSWDVVNEALNEDGTMRRSVFLQQLGEEFVVEAFRMAQQAAPNTKLYYNDYNIEQPKKRAGTIALIKKIQAAGVRIDGVGIQGHWRSYDLPLENIENSIREYAALGIEVMFTELDLSVLPNPGPVTADISQSSGYSEKMNPYKTALPDSMQTQLSNAYADLFRLFMKYKTNISRVTFWGVHDGQSWLNDFPVRGRTNYPLLFDRNYQPKPAFEAVIKTARSSSN